MRELSTFQTAVARVQAWLETDGSLYAKRKYDGAAAHCTWEVQPDDPLLNHKPIEVRLPASFPARPVQIHVDPALCLRLPHVERDGRVCLGVEADPGDYADPVRAVAHAVHQFHTLLENARRPEWLEAEFQRERASYWASYCRRRARGALGRPTARNTLLDLDAFTGRTEGTVASYFSSSSRRADRQIACLGRKDPCALAKRHGFALGTCVMNSALVIEMPERTPWTPSTWPEDFEQLEALTDALCNETGSIRRWLARSVRRFPRSRARAKKAKDGQQEGARHREPLLVLLVQPGAVYGFQLYPAIAGGLPAVQPLQVTRVDPAWCLARDHELPTFAARQSRRVVVFGCGSLGSPLCELLARSGVGLIDIVDPELFEPPNASRHSLGLSSEGRSKALALAEKIRGWAPGLTVRGFCKTAHEWIQEQDTKGHYDLVLDCTGESSVRCMLTHVRATGFGSTPVIHAWVEPYCAAAHVVLTRLDEPWPQDDPAKRVNVADFSGVPARVELPACGQGFHPYGMADVTQAAGFATERVLAVLDDETLGPCVWSWVRSRAFFATLPVRPQITGLVPESGSRFDAIMITRDLASVLGT